MGKRTGERPPSSLNAPVISIHWPKLLDGTDAGVRTVDIGNGKVAVMPIRISAEVRTSDGRSIVLEGDSTDTGEVELRAVTITRVDGFPLLLPADTKSSRKWLDTVRDAAILLQSEIAEVPTGVDPRSGRALVKRLRTSRRPGVPPPDPANVLEAGELRAQGMTYEQIAETLSIGKSTAERWVRQARQLAEEVDTDE